MSRPKNEPLLMATTPQGALLLPQGRYIHLFQPLHTHRRVTVLGVVGGGGGWGSQSTQNYFRGTHACWEKQILPRIFCSIRAAKVVSFMYTFSSLSYKLCKIFQVYLPRLGYISWNKKNLKLSDRQM